MVLEATVKPDAEYVVGDIVPWHFSPGIVVASFFASLVGCILTVELLHRKRLGKSWASRLQLLACATAFGLIGIWCMHFIGERSIVLGLGQANLQLAYSPGFTFLSCVLPVVGLSFAFYIAELRIRSVLMRRVLDITTGLLAGLSIVGMHYCGNLGTANYTMIYPPRFIIASCIIAIGDCIIALMLFFYLKEKWINALWKRVACALLLAVAVCGMHYTASIGCAYRLKSLNVSDTQRNIAVIVAGVLCFVAAIIVFAIIGYTAMRNKQLAKKAQQVNLVCAYFDKEGNILVTNEGVLPSQKIAKRFKLRSLDEEFNTAHPIFHWIWKVSHDWEAVIDLLPRMRSHLRRFDPSNYASRPTTSHSSVSSFDEESSGDESLLFREGFCVASADIADRLRVRLDQLGVMYDNIIGTGVLPTSMSSKRQLSQLDVASIASSSSYERGQVLFFTQVLSAESIDTFCAAGYRFAPPSRVEAMIAQTMQIPVQYVASNIKALQEYAREVSNPTTVKLGTYLTCFAALGRLTRQFDVLVNTANKSQLPDVQLSPGHLTGSQIAFLRQYDGYSAGELVADLRKKRADEHEILGEDRGFILLLINSLITLSQQVSEEWFNELIFNARPIISHYGISGSSSCTAMVFGLTKLLDIHHSVVKQPDRLTFVPLDFFRVRNAFYPGCPERTKFRAQVHSEFAPILAKPVVIQEQALPEKSGLSRAMGRVTTKFSRHKHDDDGDLKEDNSSVRNLFRSDSQSTKAYGSVVTTNIAPPSLPADYGGNAPMWGGILATTDTVVVAHDTKTSGAIEMKPVSPMITTIAMPESKSDGKTFADYLYEQAKSRGVAKRDERSRSMG